MLARKQQLSLSHNKHNYYEYQLISQWRASIKDYSEHLSSGRRCVNSGGRHEDYGQHASQYGRVLGYAISKVLK